MNEFLWMIPVAFATAGFVAGFLLGRLYQQDKDYKEWCLIHEYVDGFGAMGDAVTCANCGFSKYPEVAPGLLLAKILGKYHSEKDKDYKEWVRRAQEATRKQT